MPEVDPKGSREDVALYIRAVKLLAEPNATFSTVATALGVDRRTLFSWRHDPAYVVVLDMLLEGTLHAARAELRVLVLDAVKVFREALTCGAVDRDDAAKWAVRLQAARGVLDRVGISPETIGKLEISDEDLDALAVRIGWQMAPASALPSKTKTTRAKAARH